MLLTTTVVERDMNPALQSSEARGEVDNRQTHQVSSDWDREGINSSGGAFTSDVVFSAKTLRGGKDLGC